jgi:hypothetical protein
MTTRVFSGSERGDRLVGQHNLGLLHERAANRHPLLLPAGKTLRSLCGNSGEPKLIECRHRNDLVLSTPQFGQGLPGRRIGQTAHQDVIQDIEPANQIELLEDHRAAPAPVAQFAAMKSGDIYSAPRDAAVTRLGQPIEEAQ